MSAPKRALFATVIDFIVSSDGLPFFLLLNQPYDFEYMLAFCYI